MRNLVGGVMTPPYDGIPTNNNSSVTEINLFFSFIL